MKTAFHASFATPNCSTKSAVTIESTTLTNSDSGASQASIRAYLGRDFRKASSILSRDHVDLLGNIQPHGCLIDHIAADVHDQGLRITTSWKGLSPCWTALLVRHGACCSAASSNSGLCSNPRTPNAWNARKPHCLQTVIAIGIAGPPSVMSRRSLHRLKRKAVFESELSVPASRASQAHPAFVEALHDHLPLARGEQDDIRLLWRLIRHERKYHVREGGCPSGVGGCVPVRRTLLMPIRRTAFSRKSVKGHQDLNDGGQETWTVADNTTGRWWPPDLHGVRPTASPPCR